MAPEDADDGWFSARRCRWAVAALMLAALWARLATLEFALPFQQEPDTHILGQVADLSRAELSERDLFYTSIYPHLIARLALLTGAEPAPPQPSAAMTLDEHLAAAGALHLHVRRIVAWLSILVIPAAWWIARAFLRRGWALFAAALTATSTLSLQFGQMARPHAVAAALMALAIAAALRLRRRGDTSSFVLAGLAAALALGSLQYAGAVLPAALAAYLLRNGARRRVLDARVLIPLALLALSLYVFWPFLFVPTPADAAATPGATSAQTGGATFVRFLAVVLLGVFGAVLWIVQSLRPVAGARRYLPLALLAGAAAIGYTLRGEVIHVAWQTFDLKHFDGGGRTVVGMTLWFYEPVVLALGVAGVLAWLVRRVRGPDAEGSERRKDFVVVVAYALPYLLVLLLFRGVQQRFLLPLIPVFACVAAWGAQQLAALVARRAASVALAGLALAVPTLACAGYWGMRSRPQTLEQLAAWMRERQAETPRRFAMHPLHDVPLARAARNLFAADGALLRATDGTPLVADKSPWMRYQTHAMGAAWNGERFDIEALYPDKAQVAWVATHAPEFVAALTADYVEVPSGEGPNVNPLIKALRAALLAARGEPVLTLPHEPRPPSAGLDGLDTPHFTWFVLTCHWFGPRIEVYGPPRSATTPR